MKRQKIGLIGLIGATVILVLGPGCTHVQQDGSEALRLRYEQSKLAVAQRQAETERFTLAEKAALLDARIVTDFTLTPYVLIAKSIRPDAPLTGHIETTSHYLAALSFRYASEREVHVQDLAEQLVLGLHELDKSNGLDGYLPKVATVRDNTLQIVFNETHSNAYAQLMFAYVCAFQQFDAPAIRSAIQDHVAQIAARIVAHKLVLRDNGNETVEFGNLNSVFSRSRQLDALVLLETSRALLPDDHHLQAPLEAEFRRVRGLGYLKTIQRLHLKIANIELPSHSSDWLNFIRLYTLRRVSDRNCYRKALQRLYRSQHDERNPVFDIIYLTSRNRYKVSIRRQVIGYLRSFPLTLNNQEIINSLNEDVERKWLPTLTKMRMMSETPEPLPISMRPLTAWEWKRNPFRIDGNHQGDGKTRFPGVDYLLAYWMANHYGFLTTDPVQTAERD